MPLLVAQTGEHSRRGDVAASVRGVLAAEIWSVLRSVARLLVQAVDG
jgi:hypothetical protein